MSTSLITIAHARELVLEATAPLGTEEVAIDGALGRVLRSDVRATGDMPPFPSSAMDGYAVTPGDAGRVLTVVGESRAGAPSDRRLTDREAIRISTGAAVPAGATAVIPQEDVTVDGDAVHLQAPVAAGQSVRQPGEDIRAGTLVLTAGIKLGPSELGAATAAGAGTLTVSVRPRVSVLCTGDELRAPGEQLRPGEIHNSNAPMLTGLATNAGAATSPADRLPDDRGATSDGISRALERSDVVIISGGVSVGPHDHVKPVLEQLGVREVFWGVSLQPGKPTWFGVAPGGQLVFGLPGNPVSAVVTFSLFATPALRALHGLRPARSLESHATLDSDVGRNRSREQAIRVRLQRTDGGTIATPNGPQGSHILTSLLGADALAMIEPGEGVVPAGTAVRLEELAG